jgi:hypothetical protein
MDLNMRSRTSAKVAEHCLDIVQALVICRFSPFNGRGVAPRPEDDEHRETAFQKQVLSEGLEGFMPAQKNQWLV